EGQLLEDDRRRDQLPVAGDAKVASLHRTIVPDVPLYGYRGKTPKVAPDAFIAPTAVLIGDVTVESGASVWFGTVLRGDMDRIVIGERSNVQDNSTIHTDEGEPTLVGADVTIGHNALVHSSVIALNVLIGQAAVLVGGNVIGEETIVGAGAVLPEKSPPLPEDVVRAILVLRANTLAAGRSGVRAEVIDLLCDMVNRRVHPAIPLHGSVGASGDLAPLAHAALVLIGEGEAIDEGKRRNG